MTRLQHQFGGNVTLLVRLGDFEVVVAIDKIGAGVLLVGVEEEVVKLPREIVVMGRVLAGAAGRVVLVNPPRQLIAPHRRPLHEGGLDRRHVHTDQLKEIVNTAVLDGQAGVRKCLAGEELGVEEEFPVERLVVQAHGDGRPLSALEANALSHGASKTVRVPTLMILSRYLATSTPPPSRHEIRAAGNGSPRLLP